MANEKYTVVVEKVVTNGKHGPYAVGSSEELGLITFSLQAPVWNETDHPEGGSIVILSGITKKRAGWRANHGRFLRPSDAQPTTQKQNQQGA